MKYIDLAESIHADTQSSIFLDEVREVLEWLDLNHDQVTGPTITAERYRQVHRMDGGYIRGYEAALDELGGRVLEDPKPTNVELLQALSREWMKSGKGDFVDFLDEAGVKAPGGDDE